MTTIFKYHHLQVLEVVFAINTVFQCLLNPSTNTKIHSCKKYWNFEVKNYPSCISMDKTSLFSIPILVEELWDGYPKKKRKASNDEVSHRVHICELKE